MGQILALLSPCGSEEIASSSHLSSVASEESMANSQGPIFPKAADHEAGGGASVPQITDGAQSVGVIKMTLNLGGMKDRGRGEKAATARRARGEKGTGFVGTQLLSLTLYY